MSPKKNPNHEPVIENRQARFSYEILDTLETGLSLKGCEVKSIREGGFELKEGYILPKKGELFLEGAYIKPYGYQGTDALSPTRSRKILAHKREIDRWSTQAAQDGLALVPLRAYFKKGRVKLEIALGRGKKNRDKRETIKKREAERNLNRAFRKN